ncbi:MAG: hypothetical protein QW051_03750 [Candidatus Aenigmatarchaeota archaeon]
METPVNKEKSDKIISLHLQLVNAKIANELLFGDNSEAIDKISSVCGISKNLASSIASYAASYFCDKINKTIYQYIENELLSNNK